MLTLLCFSFLCFFLLCVVSSVVLLSAVIVGGRSDRIDKFHNDYNRDDNVSKLKGDKNEFSKN